MKGYYQIELNYTLRDEAVVVITLYLYHLKVMSFTWTNNLVAP